MHNILCVDGGVAELPAKEFDFFGIFVPPNLEEQTLIFRLAHHAFDHRLHREIVCWISQPNPIVFLGGELF